MGTAEWKFKTLEEAKKWIVDTVNKAVNSVNITIRLSEDEE